MKYALYLGDFQYKLVFDDWDSLISFLSRLCIMKVEAEVKIMPFFN